MDHLSDRTITEYRQRKLAAAQLLALDEHLASCNECQMTWSRINSKAEESLEALSTDLVSEPAGDDHLSYEDFEALVDKRANELDREIALVHLEICPQCTAELRELEELRDSKPETVAIPAQVASRPTKSTWLSWGSWPRLAFATAAALIAVVLVWLVWKSQQSSVQPGNTQIAISTTPTPEVTPSPATIPSPELLVSLNDAGGTVTLDNDGKIGGLGELSPLLTDLVHSALSNRMKVAPTNDLRPKSGTLMGSKTEGMPFKVLTPLWAVIISDRPTFKWESYEGATSYVVKVYDSNFKSLATSLSQPATSWKIPVSLPRGQEYVWQVTATKDGEEIKSPTAPAPEARFRVLAQDSYLEIRKAQNRKPTSHLILGTLYARAGLLDDARNEFQLLQKANPDSNVARQLLRAVTKN